MCNSPDKIRLTVAHPAFPVVQNRKEILHLLSFRQLRTQRGIGFENLLKSFIRKHLPVQPRCPFERHTVLIPIYKIDSHVVTERQGSVYPVNRDLPEFLYAAQ